MIKIIAIICVYNEEEVIEKCIENAREQGFTPIVIDNGCTDGTAEILKRLNVLVFERFTEKFDCDELIKWGIVVAKQIGCDWYVIKDADDFFETYDGKKVSEVVKEANDEGYNCMRFDMYEFWPTVDDDLDIEDFTDRIRYYSYYNSRYLKMVKNSSEINLDNPHYAKGVIKESPVRLVFKHYKFINLKQGKIKVQERLLRRIEKKDICTQYDNFTTAAKFYVLERNVYSKLYKFEGMLVKKRVFDGWRSKN